MISVFQTILFLPSNLVSFPIALLFLHFFTLLTPFSLLESYSSVCGAFLDLCKAFDSVPHQPLLDLLASSDLPPPLFNWLHSYLLNHTQCTYMVVSYFLLAEIHTTSDILHYLRISKCTWSYHISFTVILQFMPGNMDAQISCKFHA